MRALAIVHQRDAGPGVFASAAADREWTLDEWLYPEAEAPADPASYDAVMSFGGAMHASQETDHPWLADEKRLLAGLLETGVPLLGVCLGSQLLAEAAGAPVERAAEPEIGWYEVSVTTDGESDPLVGPMKPSFEAFQWHSCRSPLPPGAVALAESPLALQAYRVGERAWGIQFHAEVSRSDAVSWSRHYDTDPDAVRMGIRPEVMLRDIDERIDAWNETGGELCARFLDASRAR